MFYHLISTQAPKPVREDDMVTSHKVLTSVKIIVHAVKLIIIHKLLVPSSHQHAH